MSMLSALFKDFAQVHKDQHPLMVAIMAVLVGLTTLLVLFMTRFFITRLARYASLTYPVASGRIPIVGAAVEFGMDGLNFLIEQKKKLQSNVFLVDLLIMRLHFTLGPEATRKFYKASNEDLDFAAAIPTILPELIGDSWERDPHYYPEMGHGSILRAFSSKQRLDHAANLIIEETDKAIEKWCSMEKVDLFSECSRLTVAVLLRFLVGDEVYEEKGEWLADTYDLLERDLAHPLVMTLRPLPTTPYRRLIKNRDAILAIVKECVEKKAANVENKDKDLSYLQMLLNESGTEKMYSYGFLVLAVILAARTNTAGVLAWTFAHLCENPEFMKRAVDEVQATGCLEPSVGDVGGTLLPVKDLQFLDGMMKETIRRYTSFMLFRKVTKKGGFEVEPGKIIPEGELICISPSEMHHDEQYFESPFVYKPDRWLGEDYWSSRAREMSYVQWGFLRHRCFGEKFAQQFDKYVWARVLSKCKVSSAIPNQDFPKPIYGNGFGTAMPAEGVHYWVKFEKSQ